MYSPFSKIITSSSDSKLLDYSPNAGYFVANARFEYSHRVIAFFVGSTTLVLANSRLDDRSKTPNPESYASGLRRCCFAGSHWQFVRPFITAFPGNRHVVKNMIFGPGVVVVEWSFQAHLQRSYGEERRIGEGEG
jgi:hypothetical protein